jgi:Tfp pilus assembly protein PilV
MNATSLSKRRRRDGLSMTEMVVTVAITTVAMVGGVQIMSLASRQCRMVEDRRLACLEAGNIMEQIMARPWEEITPGDVSAFELSEA